MHFVSEVFSINMSFLIYDGKIENREVRNHDSDKIHVLHLKIDLLRVTKYHFSALNKKHKILTIKRIICQLVELPCWVIWPWLFIDCSPLEHVVTILFPSMSSTTIAPCSILPGIYNGVRRVWFWHVYYWTFVFALCCEILKRKVLLLEKLYTKTVLAFCSELGLGLFVVRMPFLTRSDMKKGQ